MNANNQSGRLAWTWKVISDADVKLLNDNKKGLEMCQTYLECFQWKREKGMIGGWRSLRCQINLHLHKPTQHQAKRLQINTSLVSNITRGQNKTQGHYNPWPLWQDLMPFGNKGWCHLRMVTTGSEYAWTALSTTLLLLFILATFQTFLKAFKSNKINISFHKLYCTKVVCNIVGSSIA